MSDISNEEMKSLSVGIEEIDSDHRTFIEKMNLLLAECKKKTADVKTLTEMFHFLENYASEHFAREEKLMQAVDYPEMARHLDEHRFFREKLAEISAEKEQQNFNTFLMVQLNTFLIDWLIKHIKSEDARMCRYLLAQKIPESDAFKKIFILPQQEQQSDSLYIH